MMDTTEVVQKTFLERLQHVQAELRAIAQSAEIRQLIQSEYANYDPALTIMDAIHAVGEMVDAYEQNYCVLHLQSEQPQFLQTSDAHKPVLPFGF